MLMATLDKKLVQTKYFITFLYKFAKQKGFDLDQKQGGKTYFPTILILDDKEYTVKTTNVNSVSAKFKSARKIEMKDAAGKIRPLSHLFRTPEFGSTSSLGDLGEAIFGAAIVARFTNKNTPVNTKMVEDVLIKLKKERIQKLEFKSPNANPRIKDDVEFKLNLAQVNINALLDPSVKKSKEFTDMLAGSVKYANSSTVTAWSKLVYENNIYNKISVKSDGVGDQSGTKVDVRVMISTRDKVLERTDINVSLKAGDVKKFGQVSGIKFESQADLWSRFLGVNPPNTVRDAYDKQLAKCDLKEAMVVSYKWATNEFKKTLKTDAGVKQFFDAIEYHATNNEENVTLVQLANSTYKKYNFDALAARFKNSNIITDLKITQGNLPMLHIYIDSKTPRNKILQIRGSLQKDGTYIRNYIEKEKRLTDLISESAEDAE